MLLQSNFSVNVKRQTVQRQTDEELAQVERQDTFNEFTVTGT